MPDTNPYNEMAHGAKIEIGRLQGSEVTWTAIPNLGDFDTPANEVSEIEKTHHGSGGKREFTAGLIDAGSTDISYQSSPGDTFDLMVRSILKTRENIQIRYSLRPLTADPETFGFTQTFAGHISNFVTSTPVDGLFSSTLTIRLSGEIED